MTEQLLERTANIISTHYPGITISSARVNDEGLVNDIVIVNDELVFRFPKNSTWARDLLINEINVVKLLRKHITINIPDYKNHNDEFVVYRFIPGKNLLKNDILQLESADQERIVEQLATFLFQLHNIPLAEAESFNIKSSDVNRGPDTWLKLYENVQRELFPHMWQYSKEWVHNHFEVLVKDRGFMDYEPKLIDGDLAPYHILFNREAKSISGIIDFGTAGTGDPAADFACIIYQYGETFLHRMVRYYPDLERYVNRARFWAGTLELQWALQGVRRKDLSWFLVHIGTSRDVMPVDRP